MKITYRKINDNQLKTIEERVSAISSNLQQNKRGSLVIRLFSGLQDLQLLHSNPLLFTTNFTTNRQ